MPECTYTLLRYFMRRWLYDSPGPPVDFPIEDNIFLSRWRYLQKQVAFLCAPYKDVESPTPLHGNHAAMIPRSVNHDLEKPLTTCLAAEGNIQWNSRSWPTQTSRSFVPLRNRDLSRSSHSQVAPFKSSHVQ